MLYLVNASIVLASVVLMEGVALLVHKHVMHGPGWGWHKSHHEPHEGIFELNDLYAVVFAGVSLTMILLASAEAGPIYWIGLGMSLYGCLYFFVHDGLVHQRWPFRYVPRNAYLKRLVQAHRLHHAVDGREGCVSFGFLYAPPPRELRKELRSLHGGALKSAGSEPT